MVEGEMEGEEMGEVRNSVGMIKHIAKQSQPKSTGLTKSKHAGLPIPDTLYIHVPVYSIIVLVKNKGCSSNKYTICTYVHTYMYIHVHTCTHGTNTHVYIYMYVCVYAHMHTCTYIILM